MRTPMRTKESERLKLKADVFKAMGHPVRLGIIELISKGELCVCDIAEYVGGDMSNVSRHLSVLRQNGIVKDRKEGLKVYYRLAMPCAVDFTRCVEGVLAGRERELQAIMGGAS